MTVAVTDKVFTDTYVDLTGALVINCMFDGCILECRNKGGPTKVTHSSMKDCLFVGDGWPVTIRDKVPAKIRKSNLRHVV